MRESAVFPRNPKTHIGLLLILIAVVFQGCPGPRLPVEPTPSTTAVMQLVLPGKCPLFGDDMAYDGLSHAIDRSLSYLLRVPAEKRFSFGEDTYTATHLIKSLTRFKTVIDTRPSPAALNAFLSANYRIYQSVGGAAGEGEKPNQVLFTGYYEPYLHGSSTPTDRYRYPVYGRPKDLVTIDLSQFSSEYEGKTLVGRLTGGQFVPYFDRDAIDNGAITDPQAPIAWVDDRVDLFFLQVQGSGKIYLDNGTVLEVHFASSNGRAYRSIGKLLIDQGKIPRNEMSMQRIRAYLKAHPEEVTAVFSYNPSYVFFQTEKDGPFGCIGVKLTPGRSLAVDRRIFPMATLAFIQTEKPLAEGNATISGWTECGRFVLNQDTGGAIRGPGRADLFWGNGAYAELAAGHMQHNGQLYFLVLKPDSP